MVTEYTGKDLEKAACENKSFYHARLQQPSQNHRPKHPPPGSRKPGDAPVRSASSPARGAVKARPKVCPLAAADPADVRAAAAVARSLGLTFDRRRPVPQDACLPATGNEYLPYSSPLVMNTCALTTGKEYLPPHHWQEYLPPHHRQRIPASLSLAKDTCLFITGRRIPATSPLAIKAT